MHDASDMELLRDYHRRGSEAAFAALVQRHINLVYSVALRHVGIAAHAEEITQAVFIILARKSAGLRADTVLESWLHETTRLTALSFLRGERRRQFREQEAYMQSTLQESSHGPVWHQLAPLLDEAISRLGKKDRDAVMLRFFKDKNLREVAAALNVNESAAQRRVHRAVEKLRGFFTKRGIALSSVAITGAISANSVQAAPVTLAKSVTAVAIAKGAAASGSTLTLIKGALKIMAWTKMKTPIVISAVILLAGGVATVVLSGGSRSGDGLSTDEIFQKTQETYASLTSYSDEGKVVFLDGSPELTFTIKLARPNFYRIEWQQSILTPRGRRLFKSKISSATETNDMETVLENDLGFSLGATANIPGTFFKTPIGVNLGSSTLSEKRQADEKVENIDCYVFSSELKQGVTRTLWIGKNDFLIHQVRNVMSPEFSKNALAEAVKLNPGMMPTSPQSSGSVISTETHMNILVNKKFLPVDFE